MKRVLIQIAKIAAGFIVAAMVVGIATAAYLWREKLKDEKERLPYETPMEWRSDLSSSLGMKALVKTKLVDSNLLIQVLLDGAPSYLSDPDFYSSNKKESISFIFRDKDGFSVYERDFLLSSFDKVVDGSGSVKGLQAESSIKDYLLLDSYKRFDSLAVKWSINTNSKSPVVTPPQDHCAIGLSKAERLRRLGAHGPLKEMGLDRYAAGSHSITFFQGNILDCS